MAYNYYVSLNDYTTVQLAYDAMASDWAGLTFDAPVTIWIKASITERLQIGAQTWKSTNANRLIIRNYNNADICWTRLKVATGQREGAIEYAVSDAYSREHYITVDGINFRIYNNVDPGAHVYDPSFAIYMFDDRGNMGNYEFINNIFYVQGYARVFYNLNSTSIKVITMANNTIVGASIYDHNKRNRSLVTTQYHDVYFHNNIVHYTYTGVNTHYCLFQDSSTGYMKNNQIYGNISSYTTAIGGAVTETDTLITDPQLINVTGAGYKLKSTSPCLNTGTSDRAPDHDRFGIARPQ